MTEEERILFEKDVKKAKFGFILVIVIILIAGFLVQQCNNNEYNQLKGQYKELDKDYKKQKDGVVVFRKNRLIEKDSLNQEIDKREHFNDSLVANNNQLQEKINSIQKRKPTVNIPKTDPCYEFAVKAEEGEKCLEIIPLKDKQLENKDIQIANLEKDKVDIQTELTASEEENNKRILLQDAGDKNIDNLKDQVKTLNRTNTINKILIPVVGIAGAVIGYKLAK